MKKQTWVKVGVLCAIVVAFVVIDLVTKYVLDATLNYGDTVTVIPHLINFQVVYNIGAAWGIMSGKQIFLIVLTIIFLAIFIYYYVREKRKTWLLTITFAFLIGGCLGNLYDRIVFGYVRDFIQFDFWKSFPIFNFADVFLSVGVVLFVIYIILYFVRSNKNAKMTGITIEKNDDNNISEKGVDEAKSTKKNRSKFEKMQKNAEKIEKKDKYLTKNDNSSESQQFQSSFENSEDGKEGSDD